MFGIFKNIYQYDSKNITDKEANKIIHYYRMGYIVGAID